MTGVTDLSVWAHWPHLLNTHARRGRLGYTLHSFRRRKLTKALSRLPLVQLDLAGMVLADKPKPEEAAT